jgi:hypothetical protein
MHSATLKSPSYPLHVVRLVICALLPACIQEVAASGLSRPSIRSSIMRTLPAPGPATHGESSPYLLVCLPPPLRFAEPVEAADPVSPLPTVIGPPHPAGILEEIASTNHEAALPVTRPTATIPPPVPAQAEVMIEPARPQTGVSILPDETPRVINSAEVLPFFEFPSTAPTSAIPRSSATYKTQ